MNITAIRPVTIMPRFELTDAVNKNPGIVPPWLQKGMDTYPNVIGIDPVDPDVPTIM